MMTGLAHMFVVRSAILVEARMPDGEGGPSCDKR